MRARSPTDEAPFALWIVSPPSSRIFIAGETNRSEGVGPAVTTKVPSWSTTHLVCREAEVYQVEYDAIATTMGFSTADSKTKIPGAEPTVKEMIGDMKMIPQRGTDAPVLEDAETGRVRVMGIAAADAVNVSTKRYGKRRAMQVFDERAEEVTQWTSADSPNHRVVEGAGDAIRRSNKPKKGSR